MPKPELGHHLLGNPEWHCELCAGGRPIDVRLDEVFKLRIERHTAEPEPTEVISHGVSLADATTQRISNVFVQHIKVIGIGAPIAERLNARVKVTDANALSEEGLENTVYVSGLDNSRHDVFN